MWGFDLGGEGKEAKPASSAGRLKLEEVIKRCRCGKKQVGMFANDS